MLEAYEGSMQIEVVNLMSERSRVLDFGRRILSSGSCAECEGHRPEGRSKGHLVEICLEEFSVIT